MVACVLLITLLGDQGSIMAEEMNPDINPSLIDVALSTIKRVETEGETQPYQTLHSPVDIYIYGTASEKAYKVKQFEKLGFPTGIKDGRPTVTAQALGAYGLLDIDFNRFAKNAGLANFDFRKDEWQDPAVQDKIAKALAEDYFTRYNSWDLVRIAWFGGPERAKKINNKEATLTEMPKNVQDDLVKFQTKLNEELSKAPASTIGTEEVVFEEGFDRGIPDPVPGYVPGHFKNQEKDFVPKDINTPNQGPMGREEKMIAKLFSSLVPEANRGVLNKTPGSAREIR